MATQQDILIQQLRGSQLRNISQSNNLGLQPQPESFDTSTPEGRERFYRASEAYSQGFKEEMDRIRRSIEQPAKRVTFTPRAVRLQQQQILRERLPATQADLLAYDKSIADSKATTSAYEDAERRRQLELDRYNNKLKAYQKAVRLFEKRIPAGFVSGDTFRYLKRMYRDERYAKQDYREQLMGEVAKFEQDFPGEQLVISQKKVGGVYLPYVSAVKSDYFMSSMPINIYNQRLASVAKQPSQKVILDNIQPFSSPNKKDSPEFWVTKIPGPTGLVSRDTRPKIDYSQLVSRQNIFTPGIQGLSSRAMSEISRSGIRNLTPLEILERVKSGAIKVDQEIINKLKQYKPTLGLDSFLYNKYIQDAQKIANEYTQNSLSTQYNSAYNSLASSSSNLDKWQSKIQNDEFIGTPEEFAQYSIEFTDYERKLNRFNQLDSRMKSLGLMDVIGQGTLGLAARGVQALPSTSAEVTYTGLKLYAPTKAVFPAVLRLSNFLTATKTGKSIGAAADIYFGLEGGKAFLTPEGTPESRVGGLAVGGLSGYGLIKQGGEILSSIPRGTSRVSRLSTEAINEPFVRKRATVILEDSKGNILYHVDKNTGLAILPGGALNKGESAAKAAARELFEETGLKINLKQFDKVITEREANYIYKATVEDLNTILPNLKAQAKEVGSFRLINPRRYTGRTQLNLFSSRDVRSEDLYIGSRSAAVEDIDRTIAALAPSRKTELVNRARNELINVYGKEALRLKPNNLLKEWFLYKRGMQYRKLYINPIAESFVRRGQPVFLKKRVKKPSLKSPSSLIDFMLGRKPGQFKRFQREAPIAVGFGSRYDVPFKELRKYGGNLNTYLHGAPSKIPLNSKGGIGSAEPGFNNLLGILTGRKPLVKTVTSYAPKSKSFKVLSNKGKRGEQVLYFQPPATPTGEEAYLGASYLGLLKKGRSEELSFGFNKGTPTIYRAKAIAGQDLIFTKKAILGKEFEVGATPGTVFRIKGKPQIVNLAGKRVRIQNISLVKAKSGGLTENQIRKGLSEIRSMSSTQRTNFLNRIKRETGREYYSFNQGLIDPIQATNSLLTPVKSSSERTVPSKERIRLAETTRYLIPTSNNRYKTTASRDRYYLPKDQYRYQVPKENVKYELPGERSPFPYLYTLPRVPYKPQSPTPYIYPPKKVLPPRPRYLFPSSSDTKGSRFRRRDKRKRTKSQILPTVFEQISLGPKKGKRAKRNITGFEAFRFY